MKIAALAEWTSEQRSVVIASFLGWTLDAFDFFLLVFVIRDIAGEFRVEIPDVTFAILLTLATRPIGAFLFGRAADRWGRRPTLMVDVLLYSAIEFASGFAPNLTILLVLRALYGVAMGGEWGVGASLTLSFRPLYASDASCRSVLWHHAWSPVNLTFSRHGPRDTSHLVRERYNDEHPGLASQHPTLLQCPQRPLPHFEVVPSFGLPPVTASTCRSRNAALTRPWSSGDPCFSGPNWVMRSGWERLTLRAGRPLHPMHGPGRGIARSFPITACLSTGRVLRHACPG
jgi:hypothetical protein